MSANQFSDPDKDAIEEAAKNRTMPISLGDIADADAKPAAPYSGPARNVIEEAAKNRTMPISLGDIADEKPAAPSRRADAGVSNSTMRIDLSDVEPAPSSRNASKPGQVPTQPSAPRPPATRQIPLQSIPGSMMGPQKTGQHLPPPPKPPVAQGGSMSKKETSRIPTSPAKGTDRIVVDEPVAGKEAQRATTPIHTAAPQQSVPKTIRLKRPATTIVAVQPGSMPKSSQPETIIKTVKLSRETSKISDSAAAALIKKETTRVLMDDEEAPPSSGDKRSTKAINVPDKDLSPKTILLKKPSTVATVLHPGGLEKKSTDAIKKSTDAILASSRKGQTTRIEIMGQDGSSPETSAKTQAPSTQIKTVKLKRAGQPTTVETSAAVDAAAGEESGNFNPSEMIPEMRRRASRGQEEDDDEDQLNVAFPILAIVALLVVGALTYILSAQALPDAGVPMPASWF